MASDTRCVRDAAWQRATRSNASSNSGAVHAASERTDIHVFDHWCHVATVHDESDLADAVQTRHALAFDLDTYRLLVKRLAHPLGSDKAVFHLEGSRHG